VQAARAEDEIDGVLSLLHKIGNRTVEEGNSQAQKQAEDKLKELQRHAPML